MGSCTSAPRCRSRGCQSYASANSAQQGYCNLHAQQLLKQSAPMPPPAPSPQPPPYATDMTSHYQQQQYQQQPPQYQQSQYSPPPQLQSQYAQPQLSPPSGPVLPCPACAQPLVAPVNVVQMRCPRCQCVFSLSSPTPAYASPTYQPQIVIMRQPQVLVEPYQPCYGGGYGYGGGMSSGLGTGLAVGGGLLGGLLLADMLF